MIKFGSIKPCRASYNCNLNMYHKFRILKSHDAYLVIRASLVKTNIIYGFYLLFTNLMCFYVGVCNNILVLHLSPTLVVLYCF